MDFEDMVALKFAIFNSQRKASIWTCLPDNNSLHLKHKLQKSFKL